MGLQQPVGRDFVLSRPVLKSQFVPTYVQHMICYISYYKFCSISRNNGINLILPTIGEGGLIVFGKLISKRRYLPSSISLLRTMSCCASQSKIAIPLYMQHIICRY